jgi:hypothetical protein
MGHLLRVEGKDIQVFSGVNLVVRDSSKRFGDWKLRLSVVLFRMIRAYV